MTEILDAISVAVTPYYLWVIFLGVFGGIIIGALPGLSSVMGLSIMLPFSFGLEGIGGIMMLLGIFCGSIYGGSISAILINTPGTSASAATALDGYPMAMVKKQPGRALGISTFSSTFGGLFSAVCLCVCAPLLAKVALQFQAPEYFALAIFGLSIITGVSDKSVLKGIIGGALGLLLATVGADNMSAEFRFTFDTLYLMAGISMVPVLIGLYALAQALSTIEKNNKVVFEKTDVKITRSFPTLPDIKKIMPTVLRSSVLGTFIGAVPGTGGDIASWVSYNEAKRWSRHKEEFGHGCPEGIAAPESGNNAISGGALVPLLSLGIPGDAGTAVMLGALMIQGIAPGPLLFTEQSTTVNAVFVGLFIANIIMGMLGFLGIKWFARVINIRNTFLVPIIFTFCFVGTFALNGNVKDIYFMIIVGVIGYFLIKCEFPMPPIILGLVLGGMAEDNLKRSLVLSDGSFSVFLDRPIAFAFLLISFISMFSPILSKQIAQMRNSRSKMKG